MSALSTTRQSISQLALAFAGAGLLFGTLVMSPDGRFAGFMIMAVDGTISLISGPRRYRSIGVIAALIGVIGAVSFSGESNTVPIA